ncbi:DNA modification methylase [Desulfovibrio inopinatus]|uniref:DNA modification methylase n=1 Tax=Desulfovibrio inopinatus TaxID=102109 RepID=UPI0003FD60A1|nr:DNA modification methylase [Desulfovibrio inopinatus]
MAKLVLEHWPLDRFRFSGRNPRKYKGVVDKMIASIQEFGFRLPVLAVSDGEVVDGELRIEAARKIEMETVPVVLADGLTDSQVQAFRLLSNRSSTWADWDLELLAAEIKLLEENNFDLELTGFDMAELDALLEVQDEDLPETVPDLPVVPVTKPGNVWALGRHRLVCGDATALDDIEMALGGRLADMVFTDPPYNLDYEGKAGKIENDKMRPAEFKAFLDAAMSSLVGALKPGGVCYVAHADTAGLIFRRAFVDAGFYLASCLIWRKNVHSLGRADYQWKHEPILYGWKPGRHCFYGGRAQSTMVFDSVEDVMVLPDGSIQIEAEDDVFVVSGENLCLYRMPGSIVTVPKPQRNSAHPTMKPVELIERLIRNSSARGDVVLDAFGGSGSTLMACEQTGRVSATVELDPRFCDVIIDRWQAATGETAVLL